MQVAATASTMASTVTYGEGRTSDTVRTSKYSVKLGLCSAADAIPRAKITIMGCAPAAGAHTNALTSKCASSRKK